MRILLVSLLLLPPLTTAAQERSGEEAEPLDPSIAAQHRDGSWTVRMKDLYRYLAEYFSGIPDARPVLGDYLERRMIEHYARERDVLVTDEVLDKWIAALDKRVRRESGGTTTLEALCKDQGMSWEDFKRRSRFAIMRERVARSEMVKSDRTRDPSQELPEDTVVFVIDQLFEKAPKELDPAKLPEGVVARILGMDINHYQYGRELSFSLPPTEVARALRDLILVEATKLLDPEEGVRPEDLESQKRWFLDYERRRLIRQLPADQQVTEQMIDNVLAKRGLTREMAFANPAFLAQAKARGYFRRSLSEADLRKYYEENRKRYSDQLEVARILIIARNQPVRQAGRKVRNLQQGKALADALWLRIQQGQDFFEIAGENTEDNEFIKRNRGIVPFPIRENTPGYELTWRHGNELKPGEVSRPFFDAGRGYVIVKMMRRIPSRGFEAEIDTVRKDAAEQLYGSWRFKAVRDARKNQNLFGKR